MYTVLRLLCDQPCGATLSIHANRKTGETVVVKQAHTTSERPSGEEMEASTHTVLFKDLSPTVVALGQDSIDQELRIAEILCDHPHAHIVRFLSTPSCLPRNTLVMEYCPRGDLFSHLEQQPNRLFDEANALRYFRQVVDGVRHLHALNIAHRDLSLENVLLDDQDHAKICDFGLSTSADELADDYVGKRLYMAPEIAGGNHLYDPWSLISGRSVSCSSSC